ncbi:MAG: GDYXXLXY domain-containing protein, partial [Burkholderiales bacterium]
VENDAFGRARREELADGRLVVRLDDRGVATYVRRDGGEPLGAGEIRLRYRVRDGRVKFATNAYFFQEGTAKVYERARYGEFRASPSGELLLTHLRGESLERLGPR